MVTNRLAYHNRQRYMLRILAALAGTLILLIGLVRLWPAGWGQPSEMLYSASGTEVIQIKEIQPTSQSREQRPPPPAPLPPVVIPNDAIDEFVPLDFTDSALPIDEPGEDADRQEGTARAVAAQQPDVNARLLRYVEPEYTRAARRNDVQAEVVIEVEVNAQGRVADATVVRRTLLNEEGNPVATVDKLGYGLEAAALEAARKCLFRPARANGEPVATLTTLTIRFGR